MAEPLDDELIVLCDKSGRPLGSAPKLASHHAHTPLHQGFSLYVFDSAGRVLVTRRADHKKVWPGVWTNSVCGHPAPGESFAQAARRRLQHELGISQAKLSLLIPDYLYQTPPFKGIVEHEFCPIMAARTTQEPQPNPDEVAETRWMSWPDYQAVLKDPNQHCSWWAKDQANRLANLASFTSFTTSQQPATPS